MKVLLLAAKVFETFKPFARSNLADAKVFHIEKNIVIEKRVVEKI